MKKNLLIALFGVMVAVFSLGALAVADADPYFYMVNEAKGTSSGAEVLMRGWITEELPSGKYLFHDASGYIRIVMDESQYRPVVENVITMTNFKEHSFKEYIVTRDVVDPDVRVELIGTVDTDGDGKLFRVHSARVLEIEPGMDMSTRLTNTGGPGADD